MADTMYFLKLEGIDGESQDSDHSNEIDLQTVNYQVMNAGSFDYGTGGNTGQAKFGEVTVTKFVDKATVNLLQYCGTGKAIPKATISLNKQAGDSKLEYLKIELTNVVLTNVSNMGHGGATDPMSESLNLNYAEIKFTYQPQSNPGDASGAVVWGRNVQTNQNVG